MTIRLTDNFTLEELTRSNTATRFGVPNSPPPTIIEHLKLTAKNMESVRVICGNKPIRVFSGYRSKEVNTLVGGALHSAHLFGWAVDFEVIGQSLKETISKLRAANLNFDQIILEFNSWVHISFDPTNRKQVIEAYKLNGKTKYRAL